MTGGPLGATVGSLGGLPCCPVDAVCFQADLWASQGPARCPGALCCLCGVPIRRQGTYDEAQRQKQVMVRQNRHGRILGGRLSRRGSRVLITNNSVRITDCPRPSHSGPGESQPQGMTPCVCRSIRPVVPARARQGFARIDSNCHDAVPISVGRGRRRTLTHTHTAGCTLEQSGAAQRARRSSLTL